MFHKIFFFTLVIELGSAATSWVHAGSATAVKPSSDASAAHQGECAVSWINSEHSRWARIEAFVDTIKNPFDPLHNITVARVKSIEYSPEIGPTKKYSGEEVVDLMDADMTRALHANPIADHADNATFCESALNVFGNYMYKTSKRYQDDARSLGIAPRSDAFIAWSILNLQLERPYAHHHKDPSVSKWACDIKEELCVSDKRKGRRPSFHKHREVTVSAGYIFASKSVHVSKLTTKKQEESDKDAVRRLNKDLRCLPHYVTTENIPDFEESREACRHFLLFKAWELEQRLADFPQSTKISLCANHKHNGDTRVGLTYLRWRELDKIRQEEMKKAGKEDKDISLTSPLVVNSVYADTGCTVF
ncbi:hypothetical protein FOZ61_004480 [Perkinsus olseni]|uniref:Uncharacterized protein n=1 Tax=Perkinsus olseni TaxID=32597 RepID=A0A7J6LL09_PEROL|nr:hypothetical protein FOZ61_004480 [Perkinsus olseni]KAF4663035.1 hypothetical protein FOL46_005015 [Perkinsus olseni]